MDRRIGFRLLSFVLALCLLLPGFSASAEGGGVNNPYLLKDIRDSISAGSNPRWLMPAGDVTFFFRTNAEGVSELWKTDGTAGGTQLVKSNLIPDSSNDDNGRIPNQGQFAFYKGVLYFPAYEEGEEVVLWRSDGSLAGTYVVLNKNGETIASTNSMLINDNTLYFVYGGDYGIYSSDGTQPGTTISQFVSSIRSYLTVFRNNFYYLLWRDSPDPYVLGTLELNPPAVTPIGLAFNSVFQPTVVNDRLCFSAYEKIPGNSGWELWCMDSDGNTVEVVDVNPAGHGNPAAPYVFNGQLYFSADDGNGRQLLRTDGTPTGTMVIQDLNVGETGLPFYSFLGRAEEGGDPLQARLIYVTDNFPQSRLWSTDGTPQGTVELGSVADPNNRYSVEHDGWVYYTGYDNNHGIELWRTDGTPENTALFADISPGKRGSAPWALAPCAEKLCFAADDGQHGVELWATDGTPGGTAMVVDLNPIPPSSEPWGFTQAGNQVFFIAQDDVSRFNLWRTDGTEAGTYALNSDASVTFSDPGYIYEPQMAPVGSKVFIPANDAVHGKELWVSDGTPAGTKFVKDIYPGTGSGSPTYLTAAGSRVFFLANSPGNRRELWVSDGSEAGTYLVKDIIPNDSSSSWIELVTRLEEDVIFTVSDSNTGSTELWLSDGSPEGTSLIDSFNLIRSLTQAGEKVYFIGSQGSYAPLLIYETDGTSDGTVIVTTWGGYDNLVSLYSDGSNVFFIDEVNTYYHTLYGYDTNTKKIKLNTELYGPGISGSSRPRCFPLNPGLICEVYDYSGAGSKNRYIWLTDGTSAGTHILSGDFTDPGDFIARGSKVAFSAETTTEGRQLWESDGTAQGTNQLSQFTQTMCSPGRNYFSFPTMSYFRGQYLLLLDDAGGNPAHGCELWAFNRMNPQAYLPLLRR